MVRPLIMGIVNVTPDSFSDGGRFATADAAIAQGLRLIEEGADWLDIGGESTRPGASPVGAQQEMDRVLPVIFGLVKAGKPLSIDTMKPAVAEAAVAAGARLWNDVTGFRDPESLAAAARLKASVAVMHMQGEPRTMQAAPHYDDVVAEVGDYLVSQADALAAQGVADIWIDPGIGFGKSLAHNLALIRAISALKARTGRKLLFGASRKSLIAKIHPPAVDASARLGGSLALALYAARAGADMLRVHDVRETAEALAVSEALG
jgi:dihydropteroate synthase